MKNKPFAIFILITTIAIGVYGIKHLRSMSLLKNFSSQHSRSIVSTEFLTNVAGPDYTSSIQAPLPTSIKKYSNGSQSRLAILLADTPCAWLPLAHGLKSMGVPFLITKDSNKALKHKVVLVYPFISNQVFSKQTLQALSEHPKKGGTLIGINSVDPSLRPVFGFSESSSTKKNKSLIFDPSQPLVSNLEETEEITLRLGQKQGSDDDIRTYSYANPEYKPLAVYNDGSAAITQKPYRDRGLAVAVGIDLGYLCYSGHGQRSEYMIKTYINQFDPKLDVLLGVIRTIYTEKEPDAVTLHTVPDNKALTVLLTHDIDYEHALRNAIDYAQYENEQGIKGTYFIQTKYIADHLDTNFFNAENVTYVKQLQELGMEVGSHSVSHTLQFNKIALGNGNEKYPHYRPYNETRTKTINASILGELRVSKFLLEQIIGTNNVTAFRSGFLVYPHSLPQAVNAANYRFDSSGMSNFALTHLPFQLNYNRHSKTEVPVFEFPVTYDDKDWKNYFNRKPDAITLANKISRWGGAMNILLHPDIVGEKLEYEKKFVAAVRPFSWFGTLSEYGHWWTARNSTQIDVTASGKEKIITVDVSDPIKGLTLIIPNGWTYRSSSPDNLGITQTGNRLLIQEMHGKAQLFLKHK